MIGLALSGGGSRPMAFHLGCLRALEDVGLLNQVSVLSTISGGSAIGAYYAYSPNKPFVEFEVEIRHILRTGLQWNIACEFLRIRNLAPCTLSWMGTVLGRGIELITGEYPDIPRSHTRSELFRQVLADRLYGEMKMGDERRNDLRVVVGACELRYGTAFRFGDRVSGDWRNGRITDNAIDLALAVAASAAYPMFLPAFDRTFSFEKDGLSCDRRVLLTDGGVYDNLGIQVLEPGRNPALSLHAFPCEYVISCNAGHGQESGDALPIGYYSRVKASLNVIHRRVQDSLMNRLHYLKETGALKGFILPYLGQIDERLPWKPPELIPRHEVIGYPTDFAAMPEGWIEKLSKRGEQLTRCLLAQYLPHLL